MSFIGSTRARAPLDSLTRGAAEDFVRRVGERYLVGAAILFGSRARGTHSVDSDADIAIVLEGPKIKGSAPLLDMAGIAFDVFLETGILVEALPLWRDEFERPETYSNPTLIENIRREGVAL
jgi:uncharacterized protein